jgi:hypothetical protein
MKKIKLPAVAAVALVSFALGCAITQHTQPEKATRTTEAETLLTCAEPETEVYQAYLETVPETTQRERFEGALDPEEIELIGRTIWGEAEGVTDRDEQAAVAWCILNRVDASGKTIKEVVTAPNQFHGYYRVKGEVPESFRYLAADVMNRWNAEKEGRTNVGRVLPADYLYFIGDGGRNHFTKAYKSTAYWGWSLPSPYNY